jgi:hypothetical protein
MALDSGIPAGMTEMEASVLDSALPSLALDSGILAGMTAVGAGMIKRKGIVAGMPQENIAPAGMPAISNLRRRRASAAAWRWLRGL